VISFFAPVLGCVFWKTKSDLLFFFFYRPESSLAVHLPKWGTTPVGSHAIRFSPFQNDCFYFSRRSSSPCFLCLFVILFLPMKILGVFPPSLPPLHLPCVFCLTAKPLSVLLCPIPNRHGTHASTAARVFFSPALRMLILFFRFPPLTDTSRDICAFLASELFPSIVQEALLLCLELLLSCPGVPNGVVALDARFLVFSFFPLGLFPLYFPLLWRGGRCCRLNFSSFLVNSFLLCQGSRKTICDPPRGHFLPSVYCRSWAPSRPPAGSALLFFLAAVVVALFSGTRVGIVLFQFLFSHSQQGQALPSFPSCSLKMCSGGPDKIFFPFAVFPFPSPLDGRRCGPLTKILLTNLPLRFLTREVTVRTLNSIYRRLQSRSFPYF